MLSDAICEMIRYFGSDVRRINHALKVYGFAEAIAAREPITAQDGVVIRLAAVLHDIGIKQAESKHNSSSGKFQELEGPPIAREIMDGLGVEPAVMDRVCHLIGRHHSYDCIDGLDFQILVEADFLVNIFEDDMLREAVESVRDRIFRTRGGKDMLESMYLR